ncbi:MAG: hypothetical protein OXB88_03765 [Bacteriovoracales bacterium]|nr:hypothetical protein [Bacteriovoracales bacterium]
MKIYLFSLLVGPLFFSFSPSLKAEDLLPRYEAITPFHLHWQSYRPVEAEGCEKNSEDPCLDIELQDNREQFEALLKGTENRYDENDPKFLATPLGRQYQSLKNFMHVQDSFGSCVEEAALGTKGNLSESLDLILGNAANTPCPSWGATAPLDKGLSHLVKDVQEIVEEQLEKDLISDSLERSFLANGTFAQMFGRRKDFSAELCRGSLKKKEATLWGFEIVSSEGDVCDDKDKALLKNLQRSVPIPQAKRVGPEEVKRDLNAKIEEMNLVLQKYNEDKKALKKKWEEEDERSRMHPMFLSLRRFSRKKELMRMKKLALENLWGGASSPIEQLLKMDAVKKAAGIDQLEKMRLKGMGFGGAELKVLKNEDDFPMLSPIKKDDAAAAMEEVLSRTKGQVQDLLKRQKDDTVRGRRKNIAHLMISNPLSAGYVLRNNPQYADRFCSVAQNFTKGERNRTALRVGSYVVLGTGIVVGTVASFGGALPLTAVGLGLAAGAGMTVAEASFHQNDAKRHRELQAATLNAYLQSVGNEQSFEQVRENWQKALEADAYARAAWKFGLLDLIGVRPAVKGAQFVRMAKNLKGVDVALKQNRRLINLISKRNDYAKAMKALFENNPKEKVGDLINFMAKLEPDKQKEVLKALPQISNGAMMGDLPGFERVRAVLNNSELDELKGVVSIKPQNRARIMGDGLYFPLLKDLSPEEQDVVIEAVISMELKGKNQNQILDRLQKAMGQCSL